MTVKVSKIVTVLLVGLSALVWTAFLAAEAPLCEEGRHKGLLGVSALRDSDIFVCVMYKNMYNIRTLPRAVDRGARCRARIPPTRAGDTSGYATLGRLIRGSVTKGAAHVEAP